MRCEAKVRYGKYTLKGKSRYRAPKLDSYRPRYSSASRTKTRKGGVGTRGVRTRGHSGWALTNPRTERKFELYIIVDNFLEVVDVAVR